MEQFLRCPLASVAVAIIALPFSAMFVTLVPTLRAAELATVDAVQLKITWGHHTVPAREFFVKLVGHEVILANAKLSHVEGADLLQDGVARTSAGAGDVDGLSCALQFAPRVIEPIANAQQIWKYFLENGDSGAAQRLMTDPGYRPDSRKLTINLDEAGGRGFSLTIDQLLTQKTFWLPELDIFVAAGEPPVSFAAHQETQTRRGQRVLDRVAREPEATYAQYTALWENLGSPGYKNPASVGPGHIVCLSWDSALYKFGVDRLAEVRNDYGKLDTFHLRFVFADAAGAWREQKLADGLPVITTAFEEAGIRYEIEQFAAPLLGPPNERRGDIAMVLFQKVTLREMEGKARPVSFGIQLERKLSGSVVLREQQGAFLLEDNGGAWLAIQGAGLAVKTEVENQKATTMVELDLPANGTRQFILKLPSPVVPVADTAKFVGVDYAASRAATVKFWSEYLSKGALFSVPDAAVNTLFRANLWHALRLPRRHGGTAPDVKIDLPYSNFAYGQIGTPWPVNQSVYVDYMLYDLRGYHAVSAEELAAIYRNNQQANGYVGGFREWGVYTPGMIYSVAQHYLLSGDRASFERLLPQTLRALDWCLGEISRTNEGNRATPGLVLAPLNDGTHDLRAWAFNQAYYFAGIDLLSRALAEIQHPRAGECRAAAQAMHAAVEREFARASVRSPAVQLADGTWLPYVPCDAMGSGRLFQIWYPTDVDCGPLHLSRLKALDPRGPLTTAMLNDHEDNLFIRQWGTINEPVYNMQGTAYLLRDEPKAAIRTFYSTMACAFSHSVFEPVEHRWSWKQYFGPPSTDGAWFELYRNMLIQERDDDSLLLCQATPRAWLEDGKRINVQRAPSYYGPVSFAVESSASAGEITARVDLSTRKEPAALYLRFRHPQSQPMRSVTVNGHPWADFDAKKEWVRIPKPTSGRWIVTAKYLPVEK